MGSRTGVELGAYLQPKEKKSGRRLRMCLGWCGEKIKTHKHIRFCESCRVRKEFAASAGYEGYEVRVEVQ